MIEILEPAPDRIDPAPTTPAPPGRASPTSASSGQSRRRSARRSAARPLRGLRAGADRPRRRAVALPQQARVLLRHRRRRRARAAASTRAARWERIVDVDDCLLASERGNKLRPHAVARLGREQGLPAYDRRTQVGVLRNLVVREGRRTGQVQTRLVTSAGRFDAEARGRRSGGRTPSSGPGPAAPTRPTGVLGEETCGTSGSRRSSADCAARLSPHRLPADEHRDGRAALRASPASSPRLGGRAASSTSTAGSATIGLGMAADAGEVWGSRASPEAIVDAEANARTERHRQRALRHRRRPPRNPGR